MRQNELTGGIELRDENGERACKSKSSAVKGIAQVNYRNKKFVGGWIIYSAPKKSM